MTTFGDLVYQLGGVPVGSAIGSVGLAGGDVYFVDVANGTAAGGGRGPDDANSSVLTAYGYTTSAKNDSVILIGSGSAWAPAATLTWANSYTHLIGASAPVPGMGQRARIEASGTADITPVLTVSGTGNLFSNLKINNMHDAAADSGDVLVSGGRNMFYNSMLFGMGSTTAGARAGSWSVTVSGEENYFERCVIGCDTILRASTNAELIVTGIRNQWTNCTIKSNSVTGGKFLVRITNTGDLRSTIFEDCLFYNYATNHANTLDYAFDTSASGSTYDVILKGNNQFVGCTKIADSNSFVWGAGPASNAAFGLSNNPTA